MIMSKSGKAAVVVCLALCLVAAYSTRAEASEYVKDGYYLGAMFAYNSMDGDFDDTYTITYDRKRAERTSSMSRMWMRERASVWLSAAGLTRFPWSSATRGPFRIRTRRSGHRWRRSRPADRRQRSHLSGVRSEREDRCLCAGQTPALCAPRRRPLLARHRRQQVGGARTPWNKEAEYSGYCLNAGVGAADYFHPQWAVMGGLIHRWNTFNYLKGARTRQQHPRACVGLYARDRLYVLIAYVTI